MKKKGVSPVIATILLVGMVIALALIIFVWMRSFTRETITKFEDENIELACDKVQIQTSYSGGQILVQNIGNVPIYDMRVRLVTSGGYETENMRDTDFMRNWPRYGLNPGGTFAEGLSVSANEITIIPVLLGNSEEGKRTFACENQEYKLL
jgi:flagellin-like protein